MTVLRIVPNISGDPAAAAAFYRDVFGLDVAMDLGWIATFAAPTSAARPQISVLSEGGSGQPVPDVSIEVDDLDAVHARAVQRGIAIEYGPAREPWGVRRFFLRDPFGRLINVLEHA